MGSTRQEWGRIETDAAELTKNLQLFCESCRKIKFLAGRKDIAIADSGSE